jgi:hypothetical protein
MVGFRNPKELPSMTRKSEAAYAETLARRNRARRDAAHGVSSLYNDGAPSVAPVRLRVLR